MGLDRGFRPGFRTELAYLAGPQFSQLRLSLDADESKLEHLEGVYKGFGV